MAKEERRIKRAHEIYSEMLSAESQRKAHEHDDYTPPSLSFFEKFSRAEDDAKYAEKEKDYVAAAKSYSTALTFGRLARTLGRINPLGAGLYPNKEWMDQIKTKRDKARSKIGGKDITQTLSAIIGIFGIALAIFFLSTNLTGNVIGNMTNSTSNIIGAVLFAVGIVGAFFYFRKR